MRVEFAGTQTVAAPIKVVWERLMDADFVASCAPGVDKVEAVNDTHYKLIAMLGVIVRRVDAGDASIIDARRVELARAAAVSERDDARAAMGRELGALRLLLGAASDEPLEVEGDLATLAV